MDKNDPNQLKVFTVQEANQLLPRLLEIIRGLQKLREKILSLEVEIDAVELVADKDDSGSSPALSKKVDEYQKAISEFYSLVDEIHGLGCLLKDLDSGLVDFYSVYKGKVVYLCWKMGESKVGYWHEVGKGFTSREKIE